MTRVKYIAEGFVADAKKLLTEFVENNSPEFSVFNHIWKKHNFAAIFLGRSTKELQQFTQEIFQLTLKFLLTAELLHQIGSVYLLYALFRNQIIEPPTRIRITLQVHNSFVELKRLAVEVKNKALHYVISFLMKNAFDFVQHPSLVGPRNCKYTRDVKTNSLQMSCLVEELRKRSLSYFDNKTLKEIEELNNTYTNLSTNLPVQNHGIVTDLDIKKYLKQLPKLLCVGTDYLDTNSQSDEEQNDIGSRRAEIKSNAFASKALFRQLNAIDEDEDDERITRSKSQRESLFRKAKFRRASTGNEEVEDADKKSIKLKRGFNRRAPAEQRRSGRPKKDQKKFMELEQLLLTELGDLSDADKCKIYLKRGPPARNSYLDSYVEEPFEQPHYEMTVLSSTTSEDDDNVDNPDKPMETNTA